MFLEETPFVAVFLWMTLALGVVGEDREGDNVFVESPTFLAEWIPLTGDSAELVILYTVMGEEGWSRLLFE
jgi:hypothetical protein